MLLAKTNFACSEEYFIALKIMPFDVALISDGNPLIYVKSATKSQSFSNRVASLGSDIFPMRHSRPALFKNAAAKAVLQIGIIFMSFCKLRYKEVSAPTCPFAPIIPIVVMNKPLNIEFLSCLLYKFFLLTRLLIKYL